MKFGSLFAGIGGLDLGLERAGMKCTWQVEIDDYCTRVLEKHWPDVRRYRDVKEIHGVMAHAESKQGRDQPQDFADGKRGQSGGKSRSSRIDGTTTICPSCLEAVDLIAGGFPCQPHSVAGKQLGEEDDRNLWPEFIRVIRETRPRYVLAENVPGIITTYLDTVLSDLEGEGYTCTTFNLPACAFDAPHRRERIFIVAYSNGVRKLQPQGSKRTQRRWIGDESEDVADTELPRSSRLRKISREAISATEPIRSIQSSERMAEGQDKVGRATHWTVEPDVGRVASRIPSRVDRLRGLGNAVVPQVAEWIGRRIIEHDERSGR